MARNIIDAIKPSGRDDEREITLRRTLQQAKHCLEEALSVVVAREDVRAALDDAFQAKALLDTVILPELARRERASKAPHLDTRIHAVLAQAVTEHGLEVVTEVVERWTAEARGANR